MIFTSRNPSEPDKCMNDFGFWIVVEKNRESALPDLRNLLWQNLL